MGRTTSEEKSHVVLFPFPAQGHIPPVIYLAKKLAEQGLIVTIVNIDSIHRVVSKHWTCPPGLDIRLEQVECVVSMPHGMDVSVIKNDDVAASVLKALFNTVSPARHLLSRLTPPPCCLLADYFLTWGTSLAEELNIRAVTYWPGNAAWCSLHKYVDELVAHGDAYRDETNEPTHDGVITYIPGLDKLPCADLPEYLRKKPSETHEWFMECSQGVLEGSEWILVNSMVELEPVVFQDMQGSLRNFVSIGPLFPLSGNDRSPTGVSLRDEDYDSLEWLDTQAEGSVLYISFGSIGTLSESTFEEFAAGIKASKQPFLWVIRMDLVEDSKKERYNEFVEQTREQGLVVSWAPQVQVLSHSSVGGFLSHCGWNSTFESICQGVPVLGWPLFSDQHLNCKLLAEDWKLGKRLSRQREVSREHVEQSIKEFMQGEDMGEIRSRVKGFKETAWKTVHEGGTSHTNLQTFVNAITS